MFTSHFCYYVGELGRSIMSNNSMRLSPVQVPFLGALISSLSLFDRGRLEFCIIWERMQRLILLCRCVAVSLWLPSLSRVILLFSNVSLIITLFCL